MVVVIVLLTVVVFFVVDLLLRLALKRREEAQLRKERAEALDTGLKLDYTEEAVSLKRVEVDTPKARILAVDDEPVVLDSVRKILVLEGYSIDTVETHYLYPLGYLSRSSGYHSSLTGAEGLGRIKTKYCAVSYSTNHLSVVGARQCVGGIFHEF